MVDQYKVVYILVDIPVTTWSHHGMEWSTSHGMVVKSCGVVCCSLIAYVCMMLTFEAVWDVVVLYVGRRILSAPQQPRAGRATDWRYFVDSPGNTDSSWDRYA